MAEARPWKNHIREVVVRVGDCCARALDLLLLAPPHLETPWVITGTGDAAESGADLIALAEEKLGDACGSLAEAAVGMEEAEILALRCGGGSPAAPLRLRSIDALFDCDDGSIALGHALFSLQDARERVEKALDAIERCRGHLGAATLLLGHQAIPGVDECVDAERASAASGLEVALQKMEEIEKLVSDACDALEDTAPSDVDAPSDTDSEDA